MSMPVNSTPVVTQAHQGNHFNNACAYSSSKDDQLIAQLEYYFSQDNLIQDHYLRSQMDDEDYVPILTLCNFTKVRKYIDDVSDPEQYIATLVQTKSDVLQVDDLGLKVRAQSGPIKYRLVVREVAPNYTREDVINMFRINENSKVLSAEPTGCNSTWYVGYEFESDVQAAMDHLRNTRPNLKFHMKKISAGHYQGPSSRPAASKPMPWSNGIYAPNGQMNSSSSPWSVFSPGSTYSPAILQPASRPEAYTQFSEYQPVQKSWNGHPNKTNRHSRNYPKPNRTIYQPFNRQGIENGHAVIARNSSDNKSRQQNAPKQPRPRPTPRPIPDDSPKTRPDTRYRKSHPKPTMETPEKPSTPPSDKDSIPSPAAINSTTIHFELVPLDFPALDNVKDDSTAVDTAKPLTPPISITKKEFDEPKPTMNKIADVVRNRSGGLSPDPAPVVTPSVKRPAVLSKGPPPTTAASKQQQPPKPITPPTKLKTPQTTVTEETAKVADHGDKRTRVPTRPNRPASLTDSSRVEDEPAQVPSVTVASSWGKGRTIADAVKSGPKDVKPATPVAVCEKSAMDVTTVQPVRKAVVNTPPKESAKHQQEARKPKPVEKKEKVIQPDKEVEETEKVEKDDEMESDGWVSVEKPKKNKKVEKTAALEERVRSDIPRSYSFKERRTPGPKSEEFRRERRPPRDSTNDATDGRKHRFADRKRRDRVRDRNNNSETEKTMEPKEEIVLPPPEITSDSFGPSLGSPVVPLIMNTNSIVTSKSIGAIKSWADIASK